MSTLLRYEDWINPVRRVRRELLTVLPDEASEPPVLFVPGPAFTAGVFAEHWLGHTAGRGFPAHALTARDNGDLRAYAHDVVQTAAALPRQAVLIGHGVGAMIVARAVTRYPARAAVLVSPVLDRWTTLRQALTVNPAGALPAIFGGRLRLNARQVATATKPAKLPSYRGAEEPVGAPPVLVVGSPDDRVVPRASLDRTASRYGGAPLLFPGMGHDLMTGEGWTEPIDAILDWLGKELTA
ncbi:alpha/beta hydrolase [Actinoplanes sp. NPDC049265]|uniref:alpha/beta hydrolase n=1 Tax=Actinoplanes sp. NPDC049265 TaxID=3363902 RepID=UPI003717AFC0